MPILYSVLQSLHFLILTFVITAFATSCKTLPSAQGNNINKQETLSVEYICPSNLEWEQVKDKKDKPVEGFELISYELKEIKVRWTCVKADLNTPDIKIAATPELEELGQPPKLRTVKSFAKKNNTILAINATPWKNESYPHNAVGVVKIDNKIFFPPENKYCALCFTTEPLRAHIIMNQTEEELNNYDYAFGGFFQVLKDGKLIKFQNNRHSRICAGTNKDGSELYFFIATSIMNPKDKTGLTFEECGLILQKLGCTDVMHFDGGHSSCMVINSNHVEKPLLNRKIPIAIGLKK